MRKRVIDFPIELSNGLTRTFHRAARGNPARGHYSITHYPLPITNVTTPPSRHDQRDGNRQQMPDADEPGARLGTTVAEHPPEIDERVEPDRRPEAVPSVTDPGERDSTGAEDQQIKEALAGRAEM